MLGVRVQVPEMAGQMPGMRAMEHDAGNNRGAGYTVKIRFETDTVCHAARRAADARHNAGLRKAAQNRTEGA